MEGGVAVGVAVDTPGSGIQLGVVYPSSVDRASSVSALRGVLLSAGLGSMGIPSCRAMQTPRHTRQDGIHPGDCWLSAVARDVLHAHSLAQHQLGDRGPVVASDLAELQWILCYRLHVSGALFGGTRQPIGRTALL